MKFKHAFLLVVLFSIVAFLQPALAGDRPNPRELVSVEVGFSEQITPEQLAVFEKHGGIVDYIYQAVAFGWNGRLPRNQIKVMAKVLGPTFVFIQESVPGEFYIP